MADVIKVSESILQTIVRKLGQVSTDAADASRRLDRIKIPDTCSNAIWDIEERIQESVKNLNQSSSKLIALSSSLNRCIEAWQIIERNLCGGNIGNSEDNNDLSRTSMSMQPGLKTRTQEADGTVIEEYDNGNCISRYTDGSMSIKVPVKQLDSSDKVKYVLETEVDSDGNIFFRQLHKTIQSDYVGEIHVISEYDESTSKYNVENEYIIYSVSEERMKNRTYEMAEQDKLWETEYSKDAIEKQKRLFDNEFSEAKWNECKTDAEKDAFLERLYQRVCEINGTDSSSVNFKVLHGSGNIKDSITVKGFLGTERNIDTSLNAGVDGFYNSGNPKRMRVRVNDSSSYAEIANTIVHESRHQLQHEIINNSSLKNTYKVDQKYVDSLKDGFKHTINNESNYSNTSTDRTKAIEQELDSYGISQETKEEAIDTYILTYEYRDQQFEVDAWRTGYEIEDYINGIQNNTRA